MKRTSTPQREQVEADRHPPLPPIVFRVGITGHRPDRLDADTTTLRAQLDRVLAAVRAEVFCVAGPSVQRAPQLRLLCSLAEGVDRLAAHAALALDYRLQAPLPFPRAEYAEDFADSASVAEFEALLARADSVFELEAAPPHRDFAYRAAGHVVLRHCDLLVAVWDGEPGRGVGGTSELIDVAEETGHPVLCIDSAFPHALSFGDSSEPMAGVRDLIRATLGPLDAAGEAATAHYCAERWPKRIATTSYTLLRLLGERRFTRARAAKQIAAAAELQNPVLQRYFQWVDALAVLYGERSRSAAMRMQLLALGAVLAAIMILPFEEHRALLQALSLVEAACISALLFEAMQIRRHDWHARWMLYRGLSERLRCLDLLVPLSETLPAPESGRFLGNEGSTREFGTHFIQGVTRELGLASATVSPAFLAGRVRAIGAVVGGQAAFQHRVAHRYEAVERVLGRVGITLFALAILLCLLDVVRALSPELAELLKTHGFSGFHIATAAAILPSLGAALAGLAAQGEYKRLAVRADSMSRTLASLLRELNTQPTPGLRALQVFVSRVAGVLTSEVLDWQILVAAKPPTLPT